MDQAPPPLSFRDRRTGLIVFGVFEILLGGFLALSVPLGIIGQAVQANQGRPTVPWRLLAPGWISVLGVATAFIWLGIGSALARRWARALGHAGSWVWLVIGVASFGLSLAQLGMIDAAVRQQGQVPALALVVAKVMVVGFGLVFYVILPVLALLFYRSENVRLTCAARDPVPRWTDGCPIPLLAFCLMKGGVGLYLLAILPFYQVFPAFGTVLTGWSAAGAELFCAAFMLYAAWGFYVRSLAAWWIYLAGAAVGLLSSFVTFLWVDLIDLYRDLGFPESHLALLARSALVRGHNLAWFTAASAVVLLAFVFSLRRYFSAPPVAAAPPAA